MAFTFIDSVQVSITANANDDIPLPAQNVTTGNLLVATVGWFDGLGTATIESATDTAGNTYQIVGYSFSGGATGNKTTILYCLSATGNAANVLTIILTGGRSTRKAVLSQYSYTGTIQLGDTGAGSDTNSGGTTTTVTTSPALDVVTGSMVIAGMQKVENTTFTPTTGTKRGTLARHDFWEEIATGAGTITPGGSNAIDTEYAAVTAVFEAVGGGGNTQVLTENLTLVDQNISGAYRPREHSEDVSLSDQTIRKLIRGHVASDTLTISDDPARMIQMTFTDETLPISDESLQWQRLVRVMTESVTLIDQLISSIAGSGTVYTRTLSEAIEFSDGFFRYLQYRRTTDDGVDIIDAFSKLIAGAGITYARVMSDSVTMIDEIGNRWRFVRSELTDMFVLQDASIYGAIRGRVITESVLFTDALTQWVHLIRLLGEDVEFDDGMVFIRNTTRTYSDTLDLTDEAIRTLFLDQLQPTSFVFSINSDPFLFGAGIMPFN